MPTESEVVKPQVNRFLKTKNESHVGLPNYYGEKRIKQQWLQLELLSHVSAETILEFGPGGGFVTALLLQFGYDVSTYDFEPNHGRLGVTKHFEGNLLERLPICGNFDAVILSEVLEHLPWERSKEILKEFPARYAVISVPYQEWQVGFSIYFNRFLFKKYTSIRNFNSYRTFKKRPLPGHQWEIGYKGHPLRDWEKAIHDAGWTILKRSFTMETRSVFHLLERTSGSPTV